MLTTLEHALNKTCLIGLSYFDVNHQLLKQQTLAGKVIAVSKEQGICVALKEKKSSEKSPEFIIPADFSCWFVAPEGDFHTSTEGIKVTNPDYLVTWDIHQSRGDKQDGEQQWWQWVPRMINPIVDH